MALSSRPAASQRAYQREDMSLRMRRPPEEYVTLLSQSEQDFRAYVHDFENNPLFSRLINEGAIARVRLRGRIPREKYEEFMDEQMVAFLRDNGITEHEGWERDFLAPHALDRVAELAKKYDVAPGPLIRHLRYLRSSQQSPSEWVSATHQPPSASSGPSGDELAIERASGGDSMVDLTEIIETTREFVSRYSVSEQDFLDLILGGEATPDELAQRFDCSLREAEEVLEAADRVYLLESYNAPPAGTRPSTRPGSSATDSGPDMAVAWVEIIDDRASIQFAHDSVYAQRYHIRASTLKAALAKKEAAEAAQDGSATGAEKVAEARELLSRARLINQRLSALSRLITTLCNRQVEYLKSGDHRRLNPLAQAELARAMGEHPSTISRLIRRKTIETPWGKIPLLFLCQSKTDVVARLIGDFPKLTDQEVVSKLRDEFDCAIARRTVAYHRGKRLRRNKRRQTEDEKADDKKSNDKK